MKKIVLLICLLTLTLESFAQIKDSIIFQRPVRSSTFFHVNFALNLGAGFEQINTGITSTTGESVTLSAGGGAGIGLQLGLAMNESNLDFSFAVSRQLSALNPPLSNADGTFSRTLLEPMVKYLFWLKRNKHSINAGLGIDFAIDAEMDIDVSKIPGGSHGILAYHNTSGPLIICEYQFMSKSLSLNAGLKFYMLKYEFASVTVNGSPGSLTSQGKNNFENPDGSGIDFYFGIGYNFR